MMISKRLCPRNRLFLLLFTAAVLALGGSGATSHASPAPAPWTASFYGGAQGNVSYGNGSFTLTTSGANVWGSADEFAYVSQYLEFPYDECSTVSISAAVDSIAGYTNANASAGLMLRQDESAGSPNVMWRLLPDGKTRFTYRTAPQGSTSYAAGPTLSFPADLKLERQGDIFTAYYKSNGEWVLVKYIVLDMGTSLRAGIGAFSVATAPVTALFSNVAVENTSTYIPPDGNYADPEPVADNLLLRERFEDGSVTNLPEAVNNPVWRGVKFANIVEQGGGNRSWLRKRINSVVFAGSKEWTDYEAEMDVTFDPASTGSNTAQLLVRARDTRMYGNFYYAAGFTGGTNLTLQKALANTSGVPSSLKTLNIGNYLDGVKRRIKVRVLDNHIEVYLDGVLKIRHQDTFLPNLKGSIGIRTEQSLVYLDNITVTKLEDPLGGDYDNTVGGNFDKPAPGSGQ
ncbi:MAG: hypothetical protein K0R57_5349 [Paenibacillaceae bacterium]|jgi:hypothetical protein|nr:hypothetical protein [Paenibacillaceae bacterium]